MNPITRDKFKEFLCQFPQFSEDAFRIAIPYLKSSHLKKGDHLLEEGKRCTEVAYIVSGLLKVYYNRDGLEITTCFCKENRFTTSYKSLISGQVSELSIKAIEDSELVKIKYKDLTNLFDQHPFWQQVGHMVTQQEYIITACYSRLINDNPAKQRYLEILHNEPDLIQRVPLTDLASYLQVTPETMSRIRKEISTT